MAMNLLSDPKFGSLGPKQTVLLEAARQDSDRLYRIIENLMNISRIESGRAQFQFRQISPADIVANAVDPMRAAFAEKGLKLQVTVAADLPRVFADPVAIGSALTNLLSNALKFTPAGGEVTARAELENERISFTVADTGPGIPDQYASRIFEKFFRIPSKDGPSGAGLGLAIAKEIAEAHGGSIELSRDKKPGSEFRLSLPLTSNLPAKLSEPQISHPRRNPASDQFDRPQHLLMRQSRYAHLKTEPGDSAKRLAERLHLPRRRVGIADDQRPGRTAERSNWALVTGGQPRSRPISVNALAYPGKKSFAA